MAITAPLAASRRNTPRPDLASQWQLMWRKFRRHRRFASHMKTKLIVNPRSAGGATARQWPEIQKLLQNHGLSGDVEFTTAHGSAGETTPAASMRSTTSNIVW